MATIRLSTYSLLSLVLSAGVVTYSVAERPNFFSACVAIQMSWFRSIVLGNAALCAYGWLCWVVRRALFGEMRTLELMHVQERLATLIVQMLVGVTSASWGSLDFSCIMYLLIAIALRTYHWLAVDRVDLVFRYAPLEAQDPSAPQPQPQSMRRFLDPFYLSHVRLVFAIAVLHVVDLFLLKRALLEMSVDKPGLMPLFAIEFLLAWNRCTNATIKYLLNLYESYYLRNHVDEDTWDNKAYYSALSDILFDVARIAAHSCMLVVNLRSSSWPIHLITDFLAACASLFSKFKDLVRLHRAARILDLHIANATAADLDRENICIVCREEMVADTQLIKRSTPKRLSCGHTLHLGCLKSWMARSSACPTCRQPVIHQPAQPAQPAHQAHQAHQAVRTQPAHQAHQAARTQPAQPTSSATVTAHTSSVFVARDNLALPSGWGALPCRRDSDGALMADLGNGVWARIEAADSGFPHSHSADLTELTAQQLRVKIAELNDRLEAHKH